MASGGIDITELVLGQSIMVAFAVPGAGPVLAAGLSGVEAFYQVFIKTYPTASWSAAQAIEDLGDKIGKMLKNAATDDRFAKIESWQKEAVKVSQEITRAGSPIFLQDKTNFATLQHGIEDFHNDKSYDEVFGWFDTLQGEDEVANLELYFVARAAYQNVCFLKLQLNALLKKFKNGGPLPGYAEIPNLIIDDFYNSLSEGIAYGQPKWAALDHAFQHSVDEARAKSIKDYPNPQDSLQRNKAFAAELNKLRHDAHLEVTSEKSVAHMQAFLEAFSATKDYLEPFTADNQSKADSAKIAAAMTAAQAVRTKDLKAFGPKPSNAVRFLYESSVTGEWVDVLSDSPLNQDSVASQNAGSSNAGIYYQVGGGFLNSVFATDLKKAGQLTSVNQALQAAYDAKYGSGSFAADSSAASPRQDRLTSLIVPVSEGSPIGDNVYAMVYSVGPQLGLHGIVDRNAYKQIYVDALNEISRWNKANPKAVIKNFRITMVSTNAYGNGTTALRLDSATLILEAVKQSAKADPSLTGITMLINSNYTVDPPLEPEAFAAAAKAAGATGNSAGFDLGVS